MVGCVRVLLIVPIGRDMRSLLSCREAERRFYRDGTGFFLTYWAMTTLMFSTCSAPLGRRSL